MRRVAARAGVALAVFELVLLGAACERAQPPTPPADPFATPPALEPYPLRDVVAERLAALTAEAGEWSAPLAEVGPGIEEGSSYPTIAERAERAKPIDPEEVRGLVALSADAAGSMREFARRDLLALGPSIQPELVALARDEGQTGPVRAAAIELLSALDDARMDVALLQLLRGETDPSLRAHAAWRLAESTRDGVLPALLLRFKYEGDVDVLLWLATALARRGNYAGVEDLLQRAERAPDDPRSVAVRDTADALARDAGFADGPSLRRAWQTADAALPPEPARSAAYALGVWRFVARLSEYQLRGVDDARYVLERLGPSGGALLAPGLADRDVYVRSGVAQGLARMGPRARAAAPELARALGEPRLAPQAAAALGATRALEFEARLCSLTARGVEPGLRLAAVRALADYGPAASAATAERLRALFDAPTHGELWQAAGESLLALDAEPAVALALTPCLRAGDSPLDLDPATSERALAAWLAARAAAALPDAPALLADWRALGLEDSPFPPDPARVRAVREARASLLDTRLADASTPSTAAPSEPGR